jgi:lipopolysaccharide transport system ATP-binding protein
VRQETLPDGKVKTISGSGEATIIEAVLVNDQDERIEIVDVGQPVRIKVNVNIHKDISEIVVGYMIKDRLGQPIFGTNTHHLQQPSKNLKSGEKLEFILGFSANLGEGSYSVAVALHTADTHVANNYEWRDRAIVFNVVNINKDRFVGVAWLPTTLETHR